MAKQGEKKGYALKRERGLVPYRYDHNSERFKSGAWKNLSPSERERNEHALKMRGRSIID